MENTFIRCEPQFDQILGLKKSLKPIENPMSYDIVLY
jgi:hypothetical protein